MSKIEVTPEKVIEMRLLINNSRNNILDDLICLRSKNLPVSELPAYPSIGELFTFANQWWIPYKDEYYVPEILIYKFLRRKASMSAEKYNTQSVYWAERIDEVSTRHGLWPRSVWPKQQSSFFEYEFAYAILADIHDNNISEDPRYSKNGYEIPPKVEIDFFTTLYRTFLDRLIRTNNNLENQGKLRNYFTE